MRLLIIATLLSLSLIPAVTSAAWAKCYSHGRMVYSDKMHDPIFDLGLVSFKEAKTGKVIFITGDCVIKV